jgi:hypothetical protein
MTNDNAPLGDLPQEDQQVEPRDQSRTLQNTQSGGEMVKGKKLSPRLIDISGRLMFQIVLINLSRLSVT